jgi:hypothetical protein
MGASTMTMELPREPSLESDGRHQATEDQPAVDVQALRDPLRRSHPAWWAVQLAMFVPTGSRRTKGRHRRGRGTSRGA